MSSGGCEISDMLLGRAKAWQGFCVLASRFLEMEVSLVGELTQIEVITVGRQVSRKQKSFQNHLAEVHEP